MCYHGQWLCCFTGHCRDGAGDGSIWPISCEEERQVLAKRSARQYDWYIFPREAHWIQWILWGYIRQPPIFCTLHKRFVVLFGNLFYSLSLIFSFFHSMQRKSTWQNSCLRLAVSIQYRITKPSGHYQMEQLLACLMPSLTHVITSQNTGLMMQTTGDTPQLTCHTLGWLNGGQIDNL